MNVLCLAASTLGGMGAWHCCTAEQLRQLRSDNLRVSLGCRLPAVEALIVIEGKGVGRVWTEVYQVSLLEPLAGSSVCEQLYDLVCDSACSVQCLAGHFIE